MWHGSAESVSVCLTDNLTYYDETKIMGMLYENKCRNGHLNIRNSWKMFTHADNSSQPSRARNSCRFEKVREMLADKLVILSLFPGHSNSIECFYRSPAIFVLYWNEFNRQTFKCVLWPALCRIQAGRKRMACIFWKTLFHVSLPITRQFMTSKNLKMTFFMFVTLFLVPASEFFLQRDFSCCSAFAFYSLRNFTNFPLFCWHFIQRLFQFSAYSSTLRLRSGFFLLVFTSAPPLPHHFPRIS